MTDMDEIRNLLDEYVSWHDEWCPQHDAKCNTVHRAKEDAARSALLKRVEALREERDLYRRQVEVRYGKAEEQIERLAAERDAALAAQKRAEEERDEARVDADRLKQGCEYRGAVLTEARAAVNEQGDYLHDADGDLARAVRMLGGDLRFNIEHRTAAESALAAASETSARLTSELARALDGQRAAETALAAQIAGEALERGDGEVREVLRRLQCGACGWTIGNPTTRPTSCEDCANALRLFARLDAARPSPRGTGTEGGK